ncbi:uncharacterized protein PADG_11066 [Paracoccidioides brasiliensis Pb18]|uniref:Uncharacterized protein n=1 Tax=Paracoccidioides brasiliensis (strain Pb18) TaxID=502780 RepID=A0A0A0HX20_PARBD|nr:uncharacterized protein PADG_11066 [Paracoccidioides brasiliensis Pb18]KGM92616.1 hypothetical protein PADG_11066 [Paracoccidioides brasiliensis Pb18]
MPLLQKLRALAEDVRPISSSDMAIPSSIIVQSQLSVSCEGSKLERTGSLQNRISCWRPFGIRNAPARSPREFLLQAKYTCRSAALLYLHRLLHPPGNSGAANATAFG